MEQREAMGGSKVSSASSPESGDARARNGKGGCGIAVIMLLCGCLLFAYALPRFLTLGRTAKLGEMKENVNAIKTAQAAYKASNGAFLAAGPHPRSLAKLNPSPAEWTPGSAFDTLGWSPDGPVRGTYQVEVLSGSLDFIVHGWIDADGDGVPAHFTATSNSIAERITPRSIE